MPISVPSVDVAPPTLASQVYVDASMASESVYRQMIPYNTTDPAKISQQESILELLISNNICNDETFKIFIAEPDLHKDKASAILDDLYCVSKLLPDEENDGISICEWQPATGDVAMCPDAFPSMEIVSAMPMENAVTYPSMAPTIQTSTNAPTLALGKLLFQSIQFTLFTLHLLFTQIVHPNRRQRPMRTSRRCFQYSERISRSRNRFVIYTHTWPTQCRQPQLRINGDRLGTSNIKLMRDRKNLV